MTRQPDHLAIAHERLCRDLDSLEQMLQVFASILELDLVAHAERMKNHLIKATEVYFEETWDSAEAMTAGLDLTFSELQYETGKFTSGVAQLNESMDEFKRIYEQFVLPQVAVLLVGSLEVYLTAAFASCLSQRVDLSDRAISNIASQHNFQNWGSSVDAFRTFLGIELCPEGVENSAIVALQQRRHVLVHRLGILDERAARQLSLPLSYVGTRLTVRSSEAKEGIELVRRIGEHLCRGGSERR